MAERDKNGRIIPKTGSLNPGGESKLVRKARRLLQKGAPEAAEFLMSVIRGDETATAMGKEGPVDIPVQPKDRVAAVKVLFEYTMQKPKQSVAVEGKGASPTDGLTLTQLLELLDRTKQSEPQSH